MGVQFGNFTQFDLLGDNYVFSLNCKAFDWRKMKKKRLKNGFAHQNRMNHNGIINHKSKQATSGSF
jgi:hypothetical protein